MSSGLGEGSDQTRPDQTTPDQRPDYVLPEPRKGHSRCSLPVRYSIFTPLTHTTPLRLSLPPSLRCTILSFFLFSPPQHGGGWMGWTSAFRLLSITTYASISTIYYTWYNILYDDRNIHARCGWVAAWVGLHLFIGGCVGFLCLWVIRSDHDRE